MKTILNEAWQGEVQQVTKTLIVVAWEMNGEIVEAHYEPSQFSEIPNVGEMLISVNTVVNPTVRAIPTKRKKKRNVVPLPRTF